MNRIDVKLNELKKENKKALITFLTAGDGGYEVTKRAVLEMERAGADIIEIGVPFSDPIAEGPVIQNADKRSIDAGTTLMGIFEMVKRLRKETDMPLLLMMYLNSIYRFGCERFFSLCNECGIDGVIVPDMPYEERDEIEEYCEKYNVHSISLVAPTSKDRIEKIVKEAKGFIYCVSSTGVTGMRDKFSTDFEEFFGQIKKYASVPCAVGFGISTAEQAKEIKKYCDGIIVGSAVVNILAQEDENRYARLSDFVCSLRRALD